jgi:hypothetical protein
MFRMRIAPAAGAAAAYGGRALWKEWPATGSGQHLIQARRRHPALGEQFGGAFHDSALGWRARARSSAGPACAHAGREVY